MREYDYVIIGSGFGGSVSALRLSEKGYRVLIIEKGKWYKPNDFPKSNWNLPKWLWLPLFRFYGIMKLTIFRHVNILSGVGVGGGSLVYANTLPVPKSAFFKSGSWKNLADWEDELKPYYEKALKMLGADENPKLFDADNALMNLAKEIGHEDKFDTTNVAVYFGKPDVTVDDPYFGGKGPARAGCNFCGGCMTGCRYNAKNTLDKNYLFLAQNLGADIMAEQEVIDVMPIKSSDGSNGYEVKFKSSTKFFGRTGSVKTKGIVFSGGVLGTVKLLLKLKRTSLPRLSDNVGNNVRTNNESLISVTNLSKDKDLSKGIAIGSILETDDNSHLEIVRYAKGSGFWRLSHLPLGSGNNIISRLLNVTVSFIKQPLNYIRVFLIKDWAKSTSVLLFMQTIDSTLKLRLSGFKMLKTKISGSKAPTSEIPESLDLVKRYGKIINGQPTSFITESLMGIPSTAHILGGAVMGENSGAGVIDKNNNVFGYKNMLVVDGSMISANPGVNPSLSITAIAERSMSKIPNKTDVM